MSVQHSWKKFSENHEIVARDTEKIGIVEWVDSVDMMENVAVVGHHKMVMVENVGHEILIPRRAKIMEDAHADLRHNEGILGKDGDVKDRGGSCETWGVSYFKSVECTLFSGASGHGFGDRKSVV